MYRLCRQWNVFFFLFYKVAIFFAAACAEQECAKFCPFDYTPLCTEFVNGGQFTFGNKCALDSYNCEHKTSKFTSVLNYLSMCFNSSLYLQITLSSTMDNVIRLQLKWIFEKLLKLISEMLTNFNIQIKWFPFHSGLVSYLLLCRYLG